MQKLLLAAKSLEDSGKKPFSAEDLVVAAWKRYPDAFGLAGHLDQNGHPLYPNSNRVYAEIMGSKPLRKQGFLRKVGSKMYRLTDAGRARALTALQETDDESPRKLAIARESVDHIRRLFDSRAAAKARAGQQGDISFFEACTFWGISPQADAKALSSRFAQVEAVTADVMTALGSAKAASARHGGVPYASEDVLGLARLHDYLQERFAEEIEVIRRRTDERK